MFKNLCFLLQQQVEQSSEIASVGAPSGLNRSVRRPISVSTNKLSKIVEENSDDKSNSDPIDSVKKQPFGCDFDKITSDTSNSSRDMNDIHGKNKPNMIKFKEKSSDNLSNNIFADKALAGDGDKKDNSFLFSRFLPEFLDRNKISIV